MCPLPEKVSGVILQVLSSIWKDERSDMVLTDQRILLLRRPNDATPSLTKADLIPRGRIPNLFAVWIRQVLSHSPNELDRLLAECQREGIDGMSAREGSLSIPYAAIESVKFKKGLTGHSIQVEYSDATDKKRKMVMRTPMSWEFLSVRWRIPPEAVNQVWASGEYARFSKEVTKDLSAQIRQLEEDYDREVKKTLLSALPAGLIAGSDGMLDD